MLELRRLKAAVGAACLAAASCAYEVAYEPDYVPEERPSYVASGAILIVMPEDQIQYIYAGSPSSETGDFTTLTIPLGDIVREISEQVFGACFSGGVVFARDREAAAGRYVIALEGNMDDFMYRYRRVIDRGFFEEEPDTWIVPEVAVSFDVQAYNAAGDLLLSKIYNSGVVAGERYLTTLRPAERINETLHATLHGLMLQAANDIRPLLAGECDVRDLLPPG